MLTTTDTRQALLRLRQTPLAFLSQTPVWVDELPGVDTHLASLEVACNQQQLMIGDRDYLLRFMEDEEVHLAAVRTQFLATPMRFHQTAARLQTTQRFPVGLAEIWVTVQQTGCSVLILDWGNGYSMVHLQPHDNLEFNALSQRLMGEDRGAFRSVYKNFWLKQEMSTVVNTTKANSNSANPQRYILVQSMHAAAADRRMQVIGVPARGEWRFYLQSFEYFGQYADIQARALEWTTWRWYLPYWGY